MNTHNRLRHACRIRATRLPTILDDYPRYIISWRLTTTMAASDVTDTLENALAVTGLMHACVRYRPRLLSDTGPCYISSDLKERLKAKAMDHTWRAPYRPKPRARLNAITVQ